MRVVTKKSPVDRIKIIRLKPEKKFIQCTPQLKVEAIQKSQPYLNCHWLQPVDRRKENYGFSQIDYCLIPGLQLIPKAIEMNGSTNLVFRNFLFDLTAAEIIIRLKREEKFIQHIPQLNLEVIETSLHHWNCRWLQPVDRNGISCL